MTVPVPIAVVYPSRTRPGHHHVVSRNAAGDWTCSCEGGTFNIERDVPCWAIADVRRKWPEKEPVNA